MIGSEYVAKWNQSVSWGSADSEGTERVTISLNYLIYSKKHSILSQCTF